MANWLDVFQVICMGVFLVVFLGRTLHLKIARGIQVFVIGKGKTGLRRLLEITFLIALPLWIIEVLLYACHADFRIFPAPLDTLLIDTLWLKILGVLLIITGFVVFILSLINFGGSWRIGIDDQKPGALVTSGIFAYTRNPIFVFVDLYFIGTFLLNGTLIFLLYAILTPIGMHFQILHEESHLARLYGKAYQIYREQVGRYFSWTRQT